MGAPCRFGDRQVQHGTVMWEVAESSVLQNHRCEWGHVVTPPGGAGQDYGGTPGNLPRLSTEGPAGASSHLLSRVLLKLGTNRSGSSLNQVVVFVLIFWCP